MKTLEERFQQICAREQKDAGTMLNLVKQNASTQQEIKVSDKHIIVLLTTSK
jgi:hypothetical protein